MNPAEVRLTSDAQLTASTLLDFWRWAFSDLCDDDIKGIFAEWMVITLLAPWNYDGYNQNAPVHGSYSENRCYCGVYGRNRSDETGNFGDY
jgi:hypothetical protein